MPALFGLVWVALGAAGAHWLRGQVRRRRPGRTRARRFRESLRNNPDIARRPMGDGAGFINPECGTCPT